MPSSAVDDTFPPRRGLNVKLKLSLPPSLSSRHCIFLRKDCTGERIVGGVGGTGGWHSQVVSLWQHADTNCDKLCLCLCTLKSSPAIKFTLTFWLMRPRSGRVKTRPPPPPPPSFEKSRIVWRECEIVCQLADSWELCLNASIKIVIFERVPSFLPHTAPIALLIAKVISTPWG